MSLSEIRNVVLLFSNPVWGGANTVPTTTIRNITALSSQIAYEERVNCNITTLTTTNADTLNGVIQGLLYVPDISRDAACNAAQYDFMSRNVTRRANLPPTNYNLIALAPWFSINCTLAYLAAARLDPIRGFIFYKPNNSSNRPQHVDSPVWNLDDNGAWKTRNQYPVFAISGLEGQKMITELGLYSGNVNQVPHGSEITQLYGPNPKDYVRIWTELTIKNPSNIPALWIFFLIVLGALLLIIGSISLTMHLVQRRRRKSLKRRVESGEVDLEAMGIKRVTVPVYHVRNFPIFTYNQEPDQLNDEAPAISPGARGTSRPAKSRRSRRPRNALPDSTASTVIIAQSTRSIRSKRSSITGSDTTATNFQPNCHICLDPFVHRLTIIRELPCGHIFHPDCIDEFLLENSSLCPMCKHCMLPKGYSPPITNSMVRRERALRRLRERVNIDDSSLESGESIFKMWSKKLFNSRHKPPSSDIPMTPINGTKSGHRKLATPSTNSADTDVTAEPVVTTNAVSDTIVEDLESAPTAEDAAAEPPTDTTAPRTRPRKKRSPALRLLPTAPEEGEIMITDADGPKGPSSFARKRMREIASKNAPFEDPDSKRPKWRRVISGIFPGFT